MENQAMSEYCPRCNAVLVKVSENDGKVVAACFHCDIKWKVKKISLTPMALAAAGLTVMLVFPLHKAAIQPEIDVEFPTQPSHLSYATNDTPTLPPSAVTFTDPQF